MLSVSCELLVKSVSHQDSWSMLQNGQMNCVMCGAQNQSL